MRNLTIRILIVGCAALALAGLYIFKTPRVEAGNGPFNGKIAFDSDDGDGNPEIYTMNAQGTGQVNISNNPASDTDPSWSPDGTKIAFASNRDGNFEIYVMNADGTNQTRLTFIVPSFDFDPSWSPDGTKIAWASVRTGNFDILVMNADGTNQTNLTNNPASDLNPSFSPDGTKITFNSDRAGGTAQIFVMNAANGSNLSQLTNSGANFSPRFSPDGKQFTFFSNRDGNFEIYVMDADGTNETRVSNNPEKRDLNPDWQPVPKVDTIGVFHPPANPRQVDDFRLRNSNTAGSPDLTVDFGQVGDQPLAGDWDGNGIDDVGVFRPSTAQFLLRQPTRTQFGVIINVTLTLNFGLTGDKAVVGDWNGDGIDTPGVFRNGQWLLTNGPNTNNTTPPINLVFNFGQAGETPVAGDWNGDGLDSIGTFQTDADWQLRNSLSAGAPDFAFNFGANAGGDLPVVGDWDGDGIDTIGLFRPSAASFLLRNTNSGGAVDITALFGQGGDQPVAGDWNGANTPPNSGVNDPSNGASSANQTQIFTTTCSDPDGWRDISTIDFKIAKSDGNDQGVPTVLWVQFDEGSNLIRLYDPDAQAWHEGAPGSGVVLSTRFVDLYLAGTQVNGSGPTGNSVQVTWQIVFKESAIMNNYKQYLKITDDAGLTTGFDKVGSWTVTR